MRSIVATCVLLVIATNTIAQDKEIVDALQKLDARVFKADSADAKLRWDSVRQLREDVNKRDVEAWRKIKTKADWETFRDEKLAALKKSLGTFPDAPKQVKVVTTKKLKGEGFTIENIIYESRPNFYVTANLYVPAKTDEPMPGFIVIHSHHNPKTQGELQDMGMNWARQGCLVLIPDMIGHGERRQHPFVDAKSFPEKFAVSRQDYWFRYNTNLQLSLVGDSLMGWMVWDLMRGLDVLYQRPNLDKSKVMVFGSVAGGGDPCAVFAALDKRITAAAPFNFGGPQPETGKLGEDAEFAFNYMGGGSWESTRNLKLSGRDGFLPWLIVGSIAPRGLIYGHEFAWDDERDPVWARFHKIWGFYDAKDKLASAKGRGSVKGQAPESTHCNNIGAEHRKPMYPTLNKWFGFHVIEKEYKRFPASELQCWTEEARKALKPKMVHEIVAKMADNPKVWLNNPDLNSLYQSLIPAVGEDMAKFIYLYRRYPTVTAAPKAKAPIGTNVYVDQLSNYVPGAKGEGRFLLNSLFDLVDSRVAINVLVNKKVVTRVYESPLAWGKTRRPELQRLFAVTTLVDPASDSETLTRINVATDPQPVLATLTETTNLGDNEVQKIIAVRQKLSAADLDSPAWLLTDAGIPLNMLRDPALGSVISTGPLKERTMKLLGISGLPQDKCTIERVPAELPVKNDGFHMERLIVRHPDDPKLAVPMVILRPLGKIKITQVVVGIAQDGKAGFLKHRAETIAELLKHNVAVCLPDLRGTGETAADGRGRQSGGTGYSATLLMHGQTVPGVQLQELTAVMHVLPSLGYQSIALWGDSFVEPNDPKMNFAVPLDAAKLPRQSEPMGGLLALHGGFGITKVKAVYVRNGLVSYRSLLDSPFGYFPHDAVVPGMLPHGDMAALVKANGKHDVRLESMVDGLNRRVDEKTLEATYGEIKGIDLHSEPSSPAEVAAWLSGRLKK